ncbi:MAG: HigA family addiction module antidote protein [Deltaproteobacteria bacterium]|nr:HigA family addiction module antidote protein [Deltaproteobacteria bacterium]
MPDPPGGDLAPRVLEELGLSANALARALHVPTNRITGVLHERRAITADTALRLARFLETTPQFWLNLQATYELRRAEETIGGTVNAEVQPFERAT